MVLDSNKNNTTRNIKRKDLRGTNKTDIQKRKTNIEKPTAEKRTSVHPKQTDQKIQTCL
jgi:hypothetical protein